MLPETSLQSHALSLAIRILSGRLLNKAAARIIDLRSEPAVGADLSAPSLRRYSQAIRAQRVERALNPANPGWIRDDQRVSHRSGHRVRFWFAAIGEPGLPAMVD